MGEQSDVVDAVAYLDDQMCHGEILHVDRGPGEGR
jgi:hypothetical protein